MGIQGVQGLEGDSTEKLEVGEEGVVRVNQTAPVFNNPNLHHRFVQNAQRNSQEF